MTRRAPHHVTKPLFPPRNNVFPQREVNNLLVHPTFLLLAPSLSFFLFHLQFYFIFVLVSP